MFTSVNDIIKVGIAQMDVVRVPKTIRTSGLGSCVGVVLYDESTKTAGMIHVMLPDSTLGKVDSLNVAKFADTGIEELISRLTKMGASRNSLVAKIAGGAQMFAFKSNNDMLRIGDRNIEATKEKLKTEGIKIIAEDTGLNYGRTIEFYPETGELWVKSVGKQRKIL